MGPPDVEGEALDCAAAAAEASWASALMGDDSPASEASAALLPMGFRTTIRLMTLTVLGFFRGGSSFSSLIIVGVGWEPACLIIVCGDSLPDSKPSSRIIRDRVLSVRDKVKKGGDKTYLDA